MNDQQKDYPLEISSNEAETICRDCAFAIYEEQTQTGCSLGKIDKFEEQDTEILEVYDETDREFYVIKGRVCVFWRAGDWKDKYEGRKDLEDIVNKETMIRMDANVYLDKNSTLKDLDKTVTSIQKGILKPVQLTIINNGSRIEKMLLARVGMKSGFKWRVENIQDDGEADRHRSIDIAIRKTSAKDCNYYFVFDAGKAVPKDFISDINKSINIDMNRFLALKSKDGNGDVGQVHMHKQIGGNRDKRFLDKIETTTRSQGCSHLLQDISKIVSSM